MRKVISLLVALVVGGWVVAAEAADRSVAQQPTWVQAQPPVFAQRERGWSVTKLAAVGVGIVAGVVVANAALPVSWGIAEPVLGGTAGAVVGNWGYRRATEEPLVRRAGLPDAEVPTLFQLAAVAD